MTKRELVELVYLKISGGKLSSDVQVERVDLMFYFPVAYNYAILQDFYERHNLAVLDRREFGFSEGTTSLAQLLTTYQATPIEDTVRGLKYIELPKNLMVLPGSRGLNSIFGPNPDSQFVIVDGQVDVVGLTPAGAGFAWYEKYPTGARMYLKGCDCTDCTLFVRMLADGGSIGLDDEVFLPTGKEMLVIDKMVEFHTRMTPENIVNENVDDIQKKVKQ